VSTVEFPRASDLLPHEGRMMLIERVVSHDGNETECTVDVSTSELFAEPDGSIPAWLALEYMAQTIAAHGGLVDRAADRPTRPGVLVSSRNLRIAVDAFAPNQRLRVRARRIRGDLGMSVFDCGLYADTEDRQPLATAKVNVYLFESYEAMFKGYAVGE
jgi:predicted hotdog family 3-hydroxylacyl-ACP dehydratase